jgi:hypothetical protein
MSIFAKAKDAYNTVFAKSPQPTSELSTSTSGGLVISGGVSSSPLDMVLDNLVWVAVLIGGVLVWVFRKKLPFLKPKTRTGSARRR